MHESAVFFALTNTQNGKIVSWYSKERLAAGKPEKGTIQLLASQKGNHVVLEVNDDGRGIDIDQPPRELANFGIRSFLVRDPNGYRLEFQQFMDKP